MPRDKAAKHMFTAAETAEIRRMHAAGATDTEMARVLGLTSNQVWRHRYRQLKLPANTKEQWDWTVAEDEKLWDICGIQGRSYKEAASQLPGRTHLAAKKRFLIIRRLRSPKKVAPSAPKPESETSLLRQENKACFEDYLRRQRLPESSTWQPGDPIT